MNIWNHDSYRSYLLEKLGSEGSRNGLRKKLADAIPVHTTFVSQVLSGRAEFSLEQAEQINEFFEHSEDEGEYFLLMLMRDRTDARALKARFERRIKMMREKRLNVSSRIKPDDKVSERDREKFYSSMVYGATRVLVSIPQYRDVSALSSALRIPRKEMQDIVEFLLRLGLLKVENDELVVGPKHVHIDNKSELVLTHHRNWRMQTLQSLQFLDRDDLHFSSCVSLSLEDVAKVKETILGCIKKNIETISESKEEVAYVMNFDFFKLLR